MTDGERVGKALLQYRDHPGVHYAGDICGEWYTTGEILAIIMSPQTEFSTGEYLTRLAHLMGVDG